MTEPKSGEETPIVVTVEDLAKLLVGENGLDYAAFMELVGEVGVAALADTDAIKRLLQSASDTARQDVHTKYVRRLKAEVADLNAQLAEAAKKKPGSDTDTDDEADWERVVAELNASLITEKLVNEGLQVDNALRAALYETLTKEDAGVAFKYVRPLISATLNIAPEELELMEKEEYETARTTQVEQSIKDEITGYMKAFEVEPKPQGTPKSTKSKGQDSRKVSTTTEKSDLQKLVPALATQY